MEFNAIRKHALNPTLPDIGKGIIYLALLGLIVGSIFYLVLKTNESIDANSLSNSN